MAKSHLYAAKRKNNTAAKPSARITSVIAQSIGHYDLSTSKYIDKDSVRMYWHDSFPRHYDYFGYFEEYPFLSIENISPRERMEFDYLFEKMDSVMVFQWNEITETYAPDAIYKEYKTIDNDKLITHDTFFILHGSGFDVEYTREYFYNTESKIVEMIFSETNGTNMQISHKDSFGYDNNDNLIFEGRLGRNGTDFELGSYTEYEYNAQK